MTNGTRLHQQVSEAAEVASGNKGCNYCHRQRPADKVKQRKDNRGRTRHICNWCVESINSIKARKK